MTAAEPESDLKHTTETQYLALTDEEIGESWPRENGTTLYVQ